MYGDNYAQHFKGFFVAPKTGNYKFTLMADDVASLYLNNLTNCSNSSASILIAKAYYWSPALTSDNDTYRTFSDLIQLEAN